EAQPERTVEPLSPDAGAESFRREEEARRAERERAGRETYDWVSQFNRGQSQQIERDIQRAERAKAEAQPERTVEPLSPDAGAESFRREEEGTAKQAQDRAQLYAAIQAYHSDFGQTTALREVWERASSEQPNTRRGYDAARNEFWKILHNESDQDANAHEVRKMLELAGYNFGRGEGAPILDLLPNRDSNDSPKQFRLSIDHKIPGSLKLKIPGSTGENLWLKVDNLRFMTEADNVERNAFFNEKDEPFKGWPWHWQRPRHRS
ncbi:hypothetical protein, partial [Arthrobacter sp. SAFR-044]|uniref:hypothetical protein n=1 Tax=Arthrobacter sp. SAFR-044 TaxID=3387278 RepID=UPI003F7B8C76